MICPTKTLDSNISSNDENLELSGYNLVSPDNPTNTKEALFAFIITIL